MAELLIVYKISMPVFQGAQICICTAILSEMKDRTIPNLGRTWANHPRSPNLFRISHILLRFETRGSHWDRVWKSSPNFGLFHPCKIMGR